MSAATKRLCTFFSGIPAGGWLVLVVLVAFGLWLHDHDAHLRQAAALSQVRSQTAEDVAGLKKQVDAAVRQANVQDAKAVSQLEAERDALERKNQDLAAQLDSLRHDEQLQAAQVATLPTSQVVTRVATQLGLGPDDLGQPAAASMLLRQGMASAVPSKQGKFDGASAPGTASRGGSRTALTEPPTAAATPANAAPVLSLSDSGARKVETALVELNSCQAQTAIETQQVSNCTQRAAADEKVIAQQADSIAQLNQALQAKDKILQQDQAEYKAELRAARGTFFSRLAHTSEHVAVGVAIGVVIGAAAR